MVLPDMILLLPELPFVGPLVLLVKKIPALFDSERLVAAMVMVLLLIVLLSAPFMKWIPQPKPKSVDSICKLFNVMKSAPSRRTTCRLILLGIKLILLLFPLIVILLVALDPGIGVKVICSL